MSSPVFNTKLYCIVTGGSKGIGRAIAVTLSTKFSLDSVVVLTGRSSADLIETQREVCAAAPGVHVRVVVGDLTNQAAFANLVTELTKDVNPSDFQHAILVNNAGSLGDISRFVRQFNSSDVDSLQHYCMLNITSTMLITSHFLSTFTKRDGLRRTIINISSLSATQPMSSMSLYCMGKAARDMLFRTLATEEPDLRVLNYAPGPVETEMYNNLCKNSVDQSIRETMAGIKTSGNLLKPEQTAAILAKVIEEDTFESGAHIDYYDAVN